MHNKLPPKFTPKSKRQMPSFDEHNTFDMNTTGQLKIPKSQIKKITKTSNKPRIKIKSYKQSNENPHRASSYTPTTSSNLKGRRIVIKDRYDEDGNIINRNTFKNGDMPNNRHLSKKSQNERLIKIANNKPKKSKAKRIVLIITIALIAIIASIGVYIFNCYEKINSSIIKTNILSSTPNHNNGAKVTLIVGNDSRSAEAKESSIGARADTIMLLIKPNNGSNKSPKIVSIPRDVPMTFPSFIDEKSLFGDKDQTITGQRAKINAAYAYGGAKLLIRTVEELSGLKINNYAEVGFGTMKHLTDELGGIRLCYDSDVDDSGSGMKWKAGCHNVNGKKALAFSRMRHQDPEGDLGRAKRQQQVVQQIAKKSMNIVKEGNILNLFNIEKLTDVAVAGLQDVIFSEDTNFWTIKDIATAFESATKDKESGNEIIPIITPNGWDEDLGSIVEVDYDKVRDFFQSII